MTAEQDWWTNTATEHDVWGGPGQADLTDPCVAAVMDSLEGSKLLDLGCGPGRLAFPIAERHSVEVVGVDWAPGFLRLSLERRLTSTAHVSFVENDGRTFPFPDASFDGAYSVNVFQHCDPEIVRGYLLEVARVLRPGGRFRFQFVPGDSHGFLDHTYPVDNVVAWCAAAGFAWYSRDDGLVHPDWCWLTVDDGMEKLTESVSS